MQSMPKNENGYVVKISENAFIDMCLSAFEAYVISKRGSRGKDSGPVEVYGQIWGHEGIVADGSSMYSVQKISIDTSAKMENDYCSFLTDALELKVNVMESLVADMEYLGDFHSHPHLQDAIEVRKEKLYRYSDEDFESSKDLCSSEIVNYRVGLVMTIAYVSKNEQPELSKRIKGDDSLLEMRLSNYRLWLKAYITYLDEESEEYEVSDKNVSLIVPCIHGLEDVFVQFGHYNNEKRKHIVKYEKDEDEE